MARDTRLTILPSDWPKCYLDIVKSFTAGQRLECRGTKLDIGAGCLVDHRDEDSILLPFDREAFAALQSSVYDCIRTTKPRGAKVLTSFSRCIGTPPTKGQTSPFGAMITFSQGLADGGNLDFWPYRRSTLAR
jgi:hypothetical protein